MIIVINKRDARSGRDVPVAGGLLGTSSPAKATMKPDQIARLRRSAALWLSGAIALASVTWTCFTLGLNFTTTAFAYLLVILLLSLLDSLLLSAIFSLSAVVCLNYFFVEPRFAFEIKYAQDL